ncbi:hypothetical protein [Methanoculleus chikugoensis]|uniref:hypothetical protein n=1 Tax=Methanoculleus chikugoensis TaxID=118126 RepID=UPI001C7E264E|nr:hypothetical protein [Methanoculleus chikugoensis]
MKIRPPDKRHAVMIGQFELHVFRDRALPVHFQGDLLFPHLFQDDGKLALTDNQIGTIEKGVWMRPGIYAFVAETGDRRADIEGISWGNIWNDTLG